jgi:hypothetical protein
VWRTREADGVEIIVTAPDKVMFCVLYANTDDKMGLVYSSLVVGSVVTFNLSGTESSCGAIIPSICNLEVSSVDPEIETASARVLAGKARYVGHLDTAKVSEEAQNEQHMAVWDDMPVLIHEDHIVCDIGDVDVIANSSPEVESLIVREDTVKEKDSASMCVLS